MLLGFFHYKVCRRKDRSLIWRESDTLWQESGSSPVFPHLDQSKFHSQTTDSISIHTFTIIDFGFHRSWFGSFMPDFHPDTTLNFYPSGGRLGETQTRAPLWPHRQQTKTGFAYTSPASSQLSRGATDHKTGGSDKSHLIHAQH